MPVGMPKWVVPEERICPICGTKFFDYKRQKYCDIECADVAYRQQIKGTTQKLRREHPEYFRKGGKYYYPQHAKKYHEAHREEMLEYNKKYHTEHKEEINAHQRLRYDKEKNSEKAKKYYAENRERINAYQRKRYQEKKEKEECLT